MRLVFLQEFDHDAVGGLGMDECDEAVDALAGDLVDQTDALGAELFEGEFDVGDGEADVVAAFASARQEVGGAAVFVGGGEEFDGAVASVEKCDLDAMVGCVEPFQECEAEDATVGGEGSVEVVDDDADVVDVGFGQVQCIPFSVL